MFSWLGERARRSFGIVRDPLPPEGLHRLTGVFLRILCVLAWLAYPAIAAALALFAFVAWALTMGFPFLGIVNLVVFLAGLVLLFIGATAISIGTNLVDRKWRTQPAAARPLIFLLAGCWVVPAIIFAQWHAAAVADEHHWTVHLLIAGYAPAVPALIAALLASFHRPLATASSRTGTSE